MGRWDHCASGSQPRRAAGHAVRRLDCTACFPRVRRGSYCCSCLFCVFSPHTLCSFHSPHLSPSSFPFLHPSFPFLPLSSIPLALKGGMLALSEQVTLVPITVRQLRKTLDCVLFQKAPPAEELDTYFDLDVPEACPVFFRSRLGHTAIPPHAHFSHPRILTHARTQQHIHMEHAHAQGRRTRTHIFAPSWSPSHSLSLALTHAGRPPVPVQLSLRV